MKKFLKWTGLVVAALVGVLLLGYAYVYFASERELGHQFAASTARPLTVPKGEAAVAEGRRVALITGCLHCHGEKFEGQFLHDFPNVARFVAPNVSALFASYDDAQLEALIRQGIKADGTGVMFMPAEMFHHLRDQDVANLIAYLRTVRPVAGTSEVTEYRPLGRLLIAKGDFKTGPAAVAKMPAPVDDGDDAVGHGRYLAMNLCTECHSQDLNGMAIAGSPPLGIVKGYTNEQFRQLMHRGKGLGNQAGGLMEMTSKARFVHLRDDEVEALFAFLQSRP